MRHRAHSSNEPIQALGSGIKLDGPLTKDYPINTEVRDPSVANAGYQGKPEPNQWFGGPALTISDALLGRFDVSIRAGSMVLRNASGLVVDSLNYGGLVDRGRQRVPGRSRSGPGWLLRACTRFRRGFSGRSRCGSRHQYQFGPLS